VHLIEEICRRIDVKQLRHSGTGVLMRARFAFRISIEWYENLEYTSTQNIQRFTTLFSPPEIHNISLILNHYETIFCGRRSGLISYLPGGDGEILGRR